MGLSTEMPSSGAIRHFRIPLEHGQLRITALNDEPMIRAIGDPPANFAPEFLERGHEIFVFLRQLFYSLRNACSQAERPLYVPL